MRSMPGSLPGSQLSNVWDSSSVQSGVSFGCAPPLQRWVAEGPGLSVSCQRRGGGASGTVTSPAEGLQSLHKPPFALGQRIQSDFTATAKAAGCSTRRCGSENLLVSQVNSLARLEWGGGGQWFEELSGYHHSGVTESKWIPTDIWSLKETS